MKNIQKLLEKASALQEIILEKATEICCTDDVCAKELSLCTRVVRETYDIVLKYCSNSGSIYREINGLNEKDNSKKPLVNDVYDIMVLEDILQDARERFKDDLHLIEHHQNPIDVIKRAKEYVNKIIEMPEEEFNNEEEDEEFTYEAFTSEQFKEEERQNDEMP